MQDVGLSKGSIWVNARSGQKHTEKGRQIKTVTWQCSGVSPAKFTRRLQQKKNVNIWARKQLKKSGDQNVMKQKLPTLLQLCAQRIPTQLSNWQPITVQRRTNTQSRTQLSWRRPLEATRIRLARSEGKVHHFRQRPFGDAASRRCGLTNTRPTAAMFAGEMAGIRMTVCECCRQRGALSDETTKYRE